MKYWIFKTEPGTYSIDDLQREKKTAWTGIRNYQVRNMIRDDMRKGDEVFIYHSSTKEVGIVGRAVIVSDTYPDPEQFKKKSHYFDPKSKKENPTWLVRDIQFVEKFPVVLSLARLREEPGLQGLKLLQKGNRLSVSPVSKAEYKQILTLAKKGNL